MRKEITWVVGRGLSIVVHVIVLAIESSEAMGVRFARHPLFALDTN